MTLNNFLAERQGFEPWVTVAGHTRVPGVPIQPLLHLSKCAFFLIGSVLRIYRRANIAPPLAPLLRLLSLLESKLSRSLRGASPTTLAPLRKPLGSYCILL